MSFASSLASLDTAEAAGKRRQWVHLMSPGVLRCRDGRRFELRNPEEVIAATLARAGGTQLPIDYDHQTVRSARNGQPAPAAGWVQKLEARATGIWGLVEWTPRAAAMLAAREYRYISPTFLHAEDGTVGPIHSAALTNTPALDLVAVASAQPSAPSRSASVMTFPKSLLDLLGLQADADEPAVIAAITALKTKAAGFDETPATMTALASTVAELAAEREAGKRQRVLDKVEMALRQKKLAPALREWAVALCSTNEPAFDTFVAQTGPAFASLFASPFTPEVEASLTASLAAEGGAQPSNTARDTISRQLSLKPGQLT